MGNDRKIKMKKIPKILLNRIKTPDGTILTSTHVHDYVTHEDKVSKEHYMVDGGREYLRRSVNIVPYEEQSVDTSSHFVIIRQTFTWGTYGKNMEHPLKFVKLCNMSNEHITAILSTQDFSVKKGNKWVQNILRKELKFRDKNNIKIEDFI